MSETQAAKLSEGLAALHSRLDREFRTAGELAAALDEIYRTIHNADLGAFDFRESTRTGPQLVREIFSFMLQVRAKIPHWEAAKLLTMPVQAGLRNVLRAARYAGDMIGELHLEHPRLEPGEAPAAAFTGTSPGLLVNPSYGTDAIEFQPGDVLLQRGMLHNSAAIARIGNVDSQFSHLAIVARAGGGDLVAVEALIEDGAVITPLEKNLAHHVGRAVLFRHRSPELATRAADMVHARVHRTLVPVPRPILYDFTMELGGYSQLYCSKLVRLAYDLASGGSIRLPPYPTLLDQKNRDFLERIGVTARETFAPGDMEIVSDFDVVAEWRDFRVTAELRLKDMIMTKLFEWMDVHGYAFRPDLAVRTLALGGRLSSYLSSQIRDMVAEVVAKVPPNMSSRAIAAIAMLHFTAEPIFEELVAAEAEAIRVGGLQLHPREALAAIEAIRQRDGGSIGYLRGPSSSAKSA